jgi:hypothetical protein
LDGKQAVEILLDSSEDKVSAFIDLIERKKPEAAVVESIQVEDYSGSVMEIESYYRYLTALQLEKIATYGGQMLKKQDSMLEKQDEMLRKMDKMLEKQDEMLRKQDETIRAIREEGRKTREKISSSTSSYHRNWTI